MLRLTLNFESKAWHLKVNIPANILLDFLNRDSREIWGTFNDYPEREHRRLLIEALNLAVFLCREYCVMPLGFLAEDSLVRSILQSRALLLDERLIRLPMREPILDDWVEKKHREYRAYPERYAGLFGSEGLHFLHRHPLALVSRYSDVGREIVISWERGPDGEAIWIPVKRTVDSSTVQRSLAIPRRLAENGEAITWTAISASLGDLPSPNRHVLRNVVQHTYFSTYMSEFDLRVLTGLPIIRSDFKLGEHDSYYEYSVVREALRVGNIWNIISKISANSLAELRTTAGHALFQEAHWQATRRIRDPRDVIGVYALPLAGGSKTYEEKLAAIGQRRSGQSGLFLSWTDLQAVEQRLIELAERATSHVVELPRNSVHTGSRGRYGRRQYSNIEDASMSLLIFVALHEELDLLKPRWNLTHQFSEMVWRGNIAGQPIRVLCAEGAGRVRAAIAVTRYLLSTDEPPTMIFVTGMCGGFAETDGISPGDVIVASSVADLGTRKVYEGVDGTAPEFRIEPFRCDDTVLRVVASGSFDERSWANEVAASFDFPKERLPRLRQGRMICADEVVSSDEWRTRLLKVWPKSCGIDMESGGAMAAAESSQVGVSVIRGVSDAANPLKADDEWRARSVRAAASLIERVLTIVRP